jgi:4-hydroxybenzoate polyprenyltransferase
MARRHTSVLHAYLRLPHTVPTLIVLAATAAFAVLAADGMPRATRLAELLLAMLGAQLAIGTVNELLDAEIDARVKPDKPIPAGLVTKWGARVFAGVALLGMIWFSARFGWVSLALCALGTAVGIAYSLWFKRSRLAWLPYLIALPLLPIWVFTALEAFDWQLLMLYPLATFASIAVHLGQSLPDVEADRASGVHNLTSALGERRAFLLCVGSILLSLLLATIGAIVWVETPAIVLAASGIAIGLVTLNVGLYVKRPQTGVMACFPCVAAATAILGLAWVLAVEG